MRDDVHRAGSLFVALFLAHQLFMEAEEKKDLQIIFTLIKWQKTDVRADALGSRFAIDRLCGIRFVCASHFCVTYRQATSLFSTSTRRTSVDIGTLMQLVAQETTTLNSLNFLNFAQTNVCTKRQLATPMWTLVFNFLKARSLLIKQCSFFFRANIQGARLNLRLLPAQLTSAHSNSEPRQLDQRCENHGLT